MSSSPKWNTYRETRNTVYLLREDATTTNVSSKISIENIKRVYKRNTNKPFDQCTQSEVQEGDPVKTNRNEECPGQVTECMLSSSPTESVDHIQNENVPEKGIECMLSPSPTESVDQILNENVPEKEIECMLSPSPTESPSVNIIDNKVSVIRFLHDGIVTDAPKRPALPQSNDIGAFIIDDSGDATIVTYDPDISFSDINTSDLSDSWFDQFKELNITKSGLKILESNFNL